MNTKYVFVNSIIALNILVSFTYSQKKTENSQRLRFDGIYVYDNGKDTIVKDYEAYRILMETKLVPDYIMKNHDPADTFVAYPGSTNLEYLKFFPNGLGVQTFAYRRNYKKALEALDGNLKHNDYDQIFYYSVIDDSILSINRGLEVKRSLIKYNGYIKNDSLFLNLNNVGWSNKSAYSEGDSIRSYKFIKND